MTYEDPFSASSAVDWFNGKEFKGMPHDIKLLTDSLTKVRPSFLCSAGVIPFFEASHPIPATHCHVCGTAFP